MQQFFRNLSMDQRGDINRAMLLVWIKISFHQPSVSDFFKKCCDIYNSWQFHSGFLMYKSEMCMKTGGCKHSHCPLLSPTVCIHQWQNKVFSCLTSFCLKTMYESHLKSRALKAERTNRDSDSQLSIFWMAPSGQAILMVVLEPTSFSKPFTGA